MPPHLDRKATLGDARRVPLQLVRLGRTAGLLEVLLNLVCGQDLLGSGEVDGESEVDGLVDVASSLYAH
jgi:hypothetical protein